MRKKADERSFSEHRERGIALLFCLFALLILTAVTASLILLSGSETSVNGNYRSEEVAFFAAKSGIYEALDRMQQSNANSIACSIPTGLPGTTQTAASGCTAAPPSVLYIINAATGQTVTPWNSSSTSTYTDTELCHEGYSLLTGMTSAPPDVGCTSVPSLNGWYGTVTSNYPWSGTSVAMPYEWVRINWKQNNSISYVSGGITPTVSNYAVNGTSSTAVCWNGASEVLLSTPTGVTTAYTSCELFQTCATASPTIGTPVLLVTALSVTPNGSRQMLQAEAALTPPTITVPPCGISDAYGFFAYGGTCSSPGLTIGGGATVDGYNSSLGPYSVSNRANLGDVGTNGGAVEEGTSSSIGGNVYVPAIGSPPGPNQGCPGDDFTRTGNGTYGGLAASTVLPVPNVNIPPNTSTTDIPAANQTVAVPGNYRNLSIGNGNTLTLTAPGIYNIDCISAGSGATISTSPATGKITINLSGAGCTSNPLSMGSHAVIQNTSQIASNIQINYAGSGQIKLTGGPQMYAVVNAPNAAVQLNGGADFYGTIMASTIDDHGGTNLHFDAADTTISGQTASTATATATGSYNILSFHSLPY